MEIYKLVNKKNGKVYIGKTTRNVNERIKEHMRKDKTVIDKAIQKYGIDNFSIDVLERVETVEELDEKEMHWINVYDSLVPKGYNQCYGGKTSVGYHHKKESKKKMSISKSNMYIGENNPFYGKTHAEESKKKMSEARKGMNHLTEEQVRALRESHHTVKVRNIETGEVFDSIKEASEKYGLLPTHITRVCKGKRKSTGGYHWEYVKQELK